MAFCTECGFKLPDEALFCPNCGSAWASAEKTAGEAPDDTQSRENDVVGHVEDDYSTVSRPLEFNNTDPNPQGVAAPRSDLGYSPIPNSGKNNSGGKTAIIVIACVVAGIVILAALAFLYFSKLAKSLDEIASNIPSGFQASPQLPSNAVLGSGEVGDGLFYITVNGAESFKNVDGKDAMRIYFTVTNNFEYPIQPWDVLQFEAYQDGSNLKETYAWEPVEEELNCKYNIRPGITILCCYQVIYDPQGGTVDFYVSDYRTGESAGSVVASFDAGYLPGAPAKLGISPIDDPQWTLQIPRQGTLDDVYDVSVTDAQLVDDEYYGPSIRVFYEFTNNSEEATSMYMAVCTYTYQDGVEISNTLSEETDSDAAYYVEINPGESIVTSCLYMLRNTTSPVEAEVESASYYNNVIGATFKIKE